MDPGRENLSDRGRNAREGSRGFRLVSPRAREIDAGERKKSKNHRSKGGDSFDKNSKWE